MDHYSLTDQEFASAFSNCTLDPSLFSHEAHLRLAWFHIKHEDCNSAEEIVSEQIKSYTAHLGADDKYNHTVTIAAVKAVNHFIQRSKTENFKDFIAENQKLKTHFKELLGYHYSTDIFNDERAKNEFIEPELLSF